MVRTYHPCSERVARRPSRGTRSGLSTCDKQQTSVVIVYRARRRHKVAQVTHKAERRAVATVTIIDAMASPCGPAPPSTPIGIVQHRRPRIDRAFNFACTAEK